MAKIARMYRKPVRINSAADIAFGRGGYLAATYEIKGSNTVISNDHNYLYYQVKKWQVEQQLVRTGLHCLHVDAHLDLDNPAVMPPKMPDPCRKGKELNAAWKYLRKNVDIASFNLPLAFDGGISDLYLLSSAEHCGAGSSRIEIYQRASLEAIGEKELEERADQRHHEAVSVERVESDSSLDAVRIHYDADYWDIYNAIDNLASSYPKAELQQRFVLSVDADYFYRIVTLNSDYNCGTGQIQEDLFHRFQECLTLIKKAIGQPKIFICTSSPSYTDPAGAKEVLNRLIGMIEQPVDASTWKHPRCGVIS